MQTMIIVDLILLAGIAFTLGCIVNQSIEIDLIKQRVRRQEASDEATDTTTYRRIVPMGGEMYREIDQPIADDEAESK